jgi:hypothetical protein
MARNIIGCTDAATEAAELAALDAAFADALHDFDSWELEQARDPLERIGLQLPRLVGHLAPSGMHALVAAFIPEDFDMGVAEVAEMIGRTPERIRQLCQAGHFGRYVPRERKWLIGRREAMKYLERRK